jgi:transposase
LQRAVVEDVQVGDEEEIVVAVRPSWRERDRCGECRRRSPGFDLGDGRRRWCALDLGSTKAFLEAEVPRVMCRRHGVVVCAVPWARHGSRFTTAFEDQTAWLAVNTSKSAVAGADAHRVVHGRSDLRTRLRRRAPRSRSARRAAPHRDR